MLGFDFFLHAGLLAGFYVEPSPFLLDPFDAFRRIPIGYLSFLLLAALLTWLMSRIDIQGWRDGLVFGLKLGALVWGAETLGLFSISTADAGLLAGWWIGQSAEMGVAGAVAGSGRARSRLRPLVVGVLALVVTAVVVTIALQSLGLAPARMAGA